MLLSYHPGNGGTAVQRRGCEIKGGKPGVAQNTHSVPHLLSRQDPSPRLHILFTTNEQRWVRSPGFHNHAPG